MADWAQSTLHPAGDGAERIAELFFWMAGGATVVWVTMIALSIYAIRSQRQHSERLTKQLVIGGGAIVPTFVLVGLLCYGLSLLPELHQPAPPGSLTIRVAGVRWWWRIEYELENGNTMETANEIRLPVDQPVEFKLTSEDVIHAFWIPSLGGKIDMIPGRQTRLRLHPTKVGTYRGACAEFCGTAHAQMNFDVVVLPQADFDRWLSSQTTPAAEPTESPAVAGKRLFISSGCGACHAIRGTSADGVVGPDLTHFGSRLRLGAGIAVNTTQQIQSWIAQTHLDKPGVEMPAFDHLGDADLAALSAYLEQLK